MSDTPTPPPEAPTPESPSTETPQTQEAPLSDPSPAPIELEIEGVKKQFKPEQILNVLKNYEELQTKSQEYQSSYQQMENLLENLRGNPALIWDLAESLGHDPRELTKSKFKEYLEYEKMTPEEKKIFELEKNLNSYKKKDEEYQQKEQEAKREQAIQSQLSKIEQEFQDFYAKNSEIKPSRDLALELVGIQKQTLDRTGKRPSVEQAYQIYQKKQEQFRKRFYESLTEEELPEQVLSLARKRLQKEARKFPSVQPSSPSPSKGKKRKSKTIQDFFG